ncbi:MULTISPECIES: Hsp20/alpha crystallin family protein [unclassified Acidisoma]|jgi:HSP20 family protein|uniref:Hsp20/alpha crystallin family protein n=1 Tax=unclassified Acidisoma TaxID=2634065 RepID=UPI001C203CEB|nr:MULTISPECIES: Hsp20/alpha crystallin family protein [unclassified Acidisoma]
MPRSARDVMWSEALAMLARTDRLHRDAFRPTASGWEPPVDVLETEAGLLVVVALPGVKADDIEVVIGSGEVLVRGTRRWPTLQRPARVHRIELPHGRFERRLPLPPGTFQLSGQDLTDGCLLLTLRRLD